MSIYVPMSPDSFELCHPVRQEDFETINAQINGEPRHAAWKPIAVRLIHEDEGKGLWPSDSPWLGAHALIFRSTVINVLGRHLREYGELLPLACTETELLLFNVTRVVDALDEDASSVQRFGSGRIMRVHRYVFRAETIRDVDIFKIPNLRVSPTFVSDRIVELWRHSGFKGLDFKKVWAAE